MLDFCSTYIEYVCAFERDYLKVYAHKNPYKQHINNHVGFPLAQVILDFDSNIEALIAKYLCTKS